MRGKRFAVERRGLVPLIAVAKDNPNFGLRPMQVCVRAARRLRLVHCAADVAAHRKTPRSAGAYRRVDAELHVRPVHAEFVMLKHPDGRLERMLFGACGLERLAASDLLRFQLLQG